MVYLHGAGRLHRYVEVAAVCCRKQQPLTLNQQSNWASRHRSGKLLHAVQAAAMQLHPWHNQWLMDAIDTEFWA